MQFDVLGPMRLVSDGDVVTISGALRRNLLAMLLVRANQAVPSDALSGALWGDRERDATARLHVQVYRLRSMLDDPERLASDESGYRLRVGPEESDAGRFETLVTEAADQDPAAAVGTLRDALDLWRGDPYDGIDLPWVTGEAGRLAERRLDALEALYRAELRSGRHAEVASELGKVADRHPLREQLHVLLMTALYRTGRRADALAAFQRERQMLIDELGLEPGPEMRDVERAILAGLPVEPDGPTTPVVVPAQLPQRPAGFVGRAAQLSALDGLLRPVTPVSMAAVVGGGGVGKTSLVLSWAHRAKDRFPDGQLYADLHGFGPDQPAAPEEVLTAFLRALGVEGTSIPDAPAERAALFRTLADGRRLLVVLDNAGSAEQVRPLLPGSETCRILVTSRDSLTGLVAREGAHRIHLERMTEPEATRLLASLLGGPERAAPEAVTELAARCAGLPLALRIAGEQLRDRPHDRITTLLAELSDARSRLDVLDTGDDDTSVRSVFAASYEHLPPAAARLLRLLGVQPGYDIDSAALAALDGTDRRATRRSTDALVRAHLVEENAAGRYSLHDLLKTYAADLADTVDRPAERQAALARLLDHYRHAASGAAAAIFPDDVADPRDLPAAAPADFDAGMRWLDAERVNLVRGVLAARSADRESYVADLSRLLTWYLDFGGYADDARQLHSRALGAARERGDPVAEGTALRGLGFVYFRAQRLEDSERVTNEALGLHVAAGATIPAAITYNCLGVLHGFMGRADEAVRNLRQSIELYRTEGLAPTLVSRPLASLGLQQRRQGDLEGALQSLDQAHSLAVEGDLLITEAQASYGLAGVYTDTGRQVEALDYAHRTVRLAQRTRFRFLEGLALYRLGTIHARRREFDEARRHHRKAEAVARATANSQLLAIALNGAAESDARAGMPDRAAESFEAALAAAIDIGSTYEEARARAGLGDALERLGHSDRATEHWRRARDLFRELHASEATRCEAKLAENGHFQS